MSPMSDEIKKRNSYVWAQIVAYNPTWPQRPLHGSPSMFRNGRWCNKIKCCSTSFALFMAATARLPGSRSKVGDDMPDLFAVSETVFAKVQSVSFDSLTPAEQTFHVVWSFEAELNNGGFDQFFFNSAGDYAPQTIAALEQIGASSGADILRRACALFPGGMPNPRRDVRQDQLENITDQNEAAFEKLDAEFYAYPDDISGLLCSYWEMHGG